MKVFLICLVKVISSDLLMIVAFDYSSTNTLVIFLSLNHVSIYIVLICIYNFVNCMNMKLDRFSNAKGSELYVT